MQYTAELILEILLFPCPCIPHAMEERWGLLGRRGGQFGVDVDIRQPEAELGDMVNGVTGNTDESESGARLSVGNHLARWQ